MFCKKIIFTISLLANIGQNSAQYVRISKNKGKGTDSSTSDRKLLDAGDAMATVLTKMSANLEKKFSGMSNALAQQFPLKQIIAIETHAQAVADRSHRIRRCRGRNPHDIESFMSCVQFGDFSF
jgi:hypothetical protein